MWEDPIVAEVRQVHAAHAAQFNNDLLAIYRDLKAEEQKSGRQFTSYPARRVVPAKKAPVKASRRLVRTDGCASGWSLRCAVMGGARVGQGGCLGGA